MFSTFARPLTAVALSAALLLSAAPASAQLELPDAGDITGLEDLLDLPGLDLADPILDPVTGVVDTLLDAVDDVLAVAPLPNLLALQGEDAIDAAIAFSQATYTTSDTAVLARDDLFADALTTGALQGLFDAPLLLTGSGDLDRRTATELVRLGVDDLVIVGGEQAINPLVLQKLGIAGIDVTRVGGPTRIETAADAAGVTAPDATTAVLTRAYSSTGDDSQAYADLLAVSPWAAENGWPVLLTQSETLTASAGDYIAGSDITEVIVIGGTGAVSQAVEDELTAMGVSVRRVSGATRFGTAVAIAEERGFADSGDADRLIIAEGGATRDDVWAPGFAAAAHAAANSAPVLLTDGPTIPAETLAFITTGISDNLLDGGPVTLCASFVDPVACEAVGLLLLGNLNDALPLLGLGLDDLTDLFGLLEGLGLAELAALLDGLDGTLDGVIGAITDGDLEGLVDGLLDGSIDGGLLDGVTDVIGGGTGVLDPVEDLLPVEDVLDAVEDVLPVPEIPVIGPALGL
jgi:putative cell wall-binding protein